MPLCQQVHGHAAAKLMRGAATALVLFVGPLGCAVDTIDRSADAVPRSETLYVLIGGWHTEIGLPVDQITGPLRSLNEATAGARYLLFGWGQREYYMAKEPTAGDLLRAAAPGPAVMLVTPLEASPADVFGSASVLAVAVSARGIALLSSYLWDELAKEPDDTPRPLASGPHPGSRFYASVSTYNVLYNCNTWVAEGLRAAGLPINGSGVILASDVVERVRGLQIKPR